MTQDQKFEAERGRLLAFIRRTLKDRQDAEDVMQDVFEEYAEAYDQGVESLGSWLIKIAQNKIIDRFRRKRHKTAFEQTIESERTTEPDTRGELRETLLEAIEALPKDQRDVFIWNELEGKTFEEIAKETGTSINTWLARKRYAIQFLRDYLKEIHDD